MCTEEWGPGSLLFSWLEEYSTLLYWNIPSRTGTCVRAYGVLGTWYWVLPPQLGVLGRVRLLLLKVLLLKVVLRTYSLSFSKWYCSQGSTEYMVCGPWVALFTAWWAPRSMLGSPIGLSRYKAGTYLLTWSLSPCWVPLLILIST